MLFSALLHTCIVAITVNLPILVPAWTVTATDAADAHIRREADFEPVFVPLLPPIAEASPDAIKTKSGDAPHRIGVSLPAVGHPSSPPPKPDYAGAQQIVSNPPHAPKGVQTIRRPDLVKPSKLAYPLRLPSMVMLPVLGHPTPAPPPQLQPVRPNPKNLRTVRTIEPTLQVRVPAVDMPKLPVVSAEPPTPPSSQRFAAAVRPEIPAPKAAIVVNAVNIPPGPLPAIPDAELASRFVVAPLTDATAEAANGNDITAQKLNNGDHSLRLSVENVSGGRVELTRAHAGVASNSSSSNPPPRSGSGDSKGASAGNATLPGLSISGGVLGRGGRTTASTSIPHSSYGLTIISGGNSGGASRDLGVFSRTDTVYTIYIPMTDAGGGPAWSMEYALLGSGPAQSGLLTPPTVLKKIPVTGSLTDAVANSGSVFLAGIIDEDGKLQALHAIRVPDPRARFAMDALAQWEFQPAVLDGKPVASKVLIGVSVLRAEEVGKQN